MKFEIRTDLYIYPPDGGISLTHLTRIKTQREQDGVRTFEGEQIVHTITKEQDSKVLSLLRNSKYGSNHEYLKLYHKLYPNKL